MLNFTAHLNPFPSLPALQEPPKVQACYYRYLTGQALLAAAVRPAPEGCSGPKVGRACLLLLITESNHFFI